MNNRNYILLLIGCLIVSSCSKETNDDSKIKSTNIPQKVSATKPSKKSNFDTSKLNSVCDCYGYALNTFAEILKIRINYKTFDEYRKDEDSVTKVKRYITQWRTIQTYCLKTYKRAMYMKNDCNYPLDSIEKKRKKLNSLGIKS